MSSELPGFASADIKCKFQFSQEYGAILLMHHPSTSVIQGDLNCLLRDGQFEHLKKKYLVTQVVNCPSYALYLSAKSSSLDTFLFMTHSDTCQCCRS